MSTARPAVLAILADIKEHPDEDGLRLILADWLEDYGDASDLARAELIRAQIDHARLPIEDPHKQAAGRLARQLQQKHGSLWLGPLEQWLAGWTFRRGLLAVSVPSAALRGRAMSLLAATETWAWVDEVYLLDARDADLARLRDCPLLEAIASLGFRRATISSAGIRALGELPLASRLRSIDLSQSPVGDGGAAELALAKNLAGLRRIDLSGCGLLNLNTGWGKSDRPPFPDLDTLILWGNRLGSVGVVRLTESNWPRLKTLDLRTNLIPDLGGAALADWPALNTVRELNLSDNQLGPRAAAALAESPHLGAIESLVLWGNPLGGEGAARLRARFGIRVHLSGAV